MEELWRRRRKGWQDVEVNRWKPTDGNKGERLNSGNNETKPHPCFSPLLAPLLILCLLLFPSPFPPPQFDINQLMTSVNVSQSLSPIHKPLESPSSVGGASGAAVEQSPVDRTKGFFPDESEPLLRCDSTSSKDSALSRNGSFITKGERASREIHQRRLTPIHFSSVWCRCRMTVTISKND